MLRERDVPAPGAPVPPGGPPPAGLEIKVGGQADADVDSELPIPKTRILCGHNIGGQFFGRAVWRDNVENDIEHYLAAVVRSARARVNRHDLEELAEEYRRERLYVGDYKGRPGFIAKMIVYLLNSKRRNDLLLKKSYQIHGTSLIKEVKR